MNCFEVYFTVTDRDNYTNVKRILTGTEQSAIQYCKDYFKLKELVSVEQLTEVHKYCKTCRHYEGSEYYNKQEIQNGSAYKD